MQVGISNEERDALVFFFRKRINGERLPLYSRVLLKRFLSKIEPVQIAQIRIRPPDLAMHGSRRAPQSMLPR
jgi:hypothetical protein